METRYPETRTIERSTRPSAKRRTTSKRKIEFVLESPKAHSAAVAGTFNDWEPNQGWMSKDAAGIWRTTISLRPGRYEYRFVVDGEWVNDPKATEFVPNSLGSTNSVLVV